MLPCVVILGPRNIHITAVIDFNSDAGQRVSAFITFGHPAYVSLCSFLWYNHAITVLALLNWC